MPYSTNTRPVDMQSALSLHNELLQRELSTRHKKRRRRAPVDFPKLPDTYRPSRYLVFKSVVEYVAALVLFVLALPILAVTAVVVKLTSRGPVFYTQTRVGKNGRPFTIYKVRTMIHNCESLTGARWSIPGDPRITPIGQFLRQSHIDELPQLVNVLRGDMALIGPRPERPEFVDKLERSLPGYRDRLAVLPGVTGLAQIQLAADVSTEHVRKKLIYDLYYINNIGVWLDGRIFIGTAFKAIGVPFRILRRLFRLPSRKIAARALQEANNEGVIRRALRAA